MNSKQDFSQYFLWCDDSDCSGNECETAVSKDALPTFLSGNSDQMKETCVIEFRYLLSTGLEVAGAQG
jgi:hypothetical protein